MSDALVDELVGHLRAAKRKERWQLVFVGLAGGPIVALGFALCFSTTIRTSALLGGYFTAAMIVVSFALRDTFAKNPAIVALRSPEKIIEWTLATRHVDRFWTTTFRLTTIEDITYVLDVPASAEAITWRALRQLAPTVGPQEDAPPSR